MNAKNDIDVLARTIYGEARNQGIKGMEAVACVVMNRVRAKKYFTGYVLVGKVKIPSVSLTCLKPYQFSCWLAGDHNRKIIENVGIDDGIFRGCLEIATRAVAGYLNDPTKCATHYINPKACKTPAWAIGKDPCVIIGDHHFYNNID